MISPEIKIQIKSLATQNPNEEICGVVFFDRIQKKPVVLQCGNLSVGRDSYFTLDPKDYLKASLKGEILYYFHSHGSDPENEYTDFSQFDKLTAENHGLKAILYHLQTDSFKEYEPNGYKPSYIGRDFEIGKNDCFSIVRDFYNTELDIKINDYSRGQDWLKEMTDIFDRKFEEEGFIEVSDWREKGYKLHDILMFNLHGEKYTDHLGIFMMKGLFLHHPRYKYSNIEPLSDSYVRRIKRVIRHKSLL